MIFELDDKGKVYNYHIAETVINSDRRLVYTHVSDFLEDGKIHESVEDLTEELTILNTIAKNRRKMRDKRGNIDFSFDEPAIELDADGHPTHIGLVDHREANDLIEEFMLLANETVSEAYHKKKLPFLYRIHEEPDAEKLTLLNAVIRPVSYTHLTLPTSDLV